MPRRRVLLCLLRALLVSVFVYFFLAAAGLAFEDLIFIDRLGKGSFGVVFRGEWSQGKIEVAIKVLAVRPAAAPYYNSTHPRPRPIPLHTRGRPIPLHTRGRGPY